MALLDCFPEIHLRNPCIIAQMVRSRPLAPDWNQPILIKLCNYRLDFTPFRQIDQFGVNNACFYTGYY